MNKPALLSPPPAQQSIPAHLRTPSPGVHRFAALSLVSPEAELEEVLEDEPVEEEFGDREVEYAGESAASYGQSAPFLATWVGRAKLICRVGADEPYETEFELANFKNERLGEKLLSLPMTGIEGHEAWQAQDDQDRLATKIAPDTFLSAPLCSTDSANILIKALATTDEVLRPSESSLPLFALPKADRVRPALASKSSNNSLAARQQQPQAPTPLFRKSSAAVTSAVAKPKWGALPSSATSSGRPTPSRPAPALASSSSARPNRHLAPFSRPTPFSTPRNPALPAASLRTTLTTTKGMPSLRTTKTSSSSSLATLPESAPTTSANDAEKELGIWGIVEDDSVALFGDEEPFEDGFRFELCA